MEIKFIKFMVGFLSLPMLAALIFAHCIANAQVAKNSFIQDIFSGMASASDIPHINLSCIRTKIRLLIMLEL